MMTPRAGFGDGVWSAAEPDAHGRGACAALARALRAALRIEESLRRGDSLPRAQTESQPLRFEGDVPVAVTAEENRLPSAVLQSLDAEAWALSL